jgi:hypothetical protein
MLEALQRRVRAIHDLERTIRVLELVRDHAQQGMNEEAPDSKKPGAGRARAFIANCNASILAAKARINDLEEKD